MATRPRYPRIGAAAASLVVTLVAILGAVGLLPVDSSAAKQVSQPGAAAAPSPSAAAGSGSADEGTLQMAGQSTGQSMGPSTSQSTSHSTALPVNSGTGRRVVFDMSNQRVWLVGPRRGDVRRTYLVSGSVTDNLKPGTYTVYSTSKHALGVDDSGTMRYMVRFAHGAHAAIGFHDIPVRDGRLVQGRDDLGTPQSHGCIRQWRPDAKALWRFAPVGTKVVVVA
jgi:hypothetical protein